MLENSEYESLKDSFIDSQRLFNKLTGVIDNIIGLEYDESGLYQDDEEMYERHWLKLSSKIIDGLSGSLDGFDIELLKNSDMQIKELNIRLSKDDTQSKINVNFNDLDALKITQIS